MHIDPQTNTYSIEVPIPATSGTKTRINLCKGCDQPALKPVRIVMGEDETTIMVEGEKLGSNPNVLTGEKIERAKTDNDEGEEITTTRWMITKLKK